MNIYEKIINIMSELQKMNLKKTGINKHTNFRYFELSDLTPSINKLCEKYKVLINIKYTKEIATMYLIDAEKPKERVEYTSPMGSINLKGAHEIQNIGAMETYSRRYLFLTSFNIAENDQIEALQGDEEYEKKRLIEEIMGLYNDFKKGEPYDPGTAIVKLKKKNVNELRAKKKELVEIMKNRVA